jgi:GNAT superfamily N-acetyltransferase
MTTLKMASSSLFSRLEQFLAHCREGGFKHVLKILAYYGFAHGWALWLADIQILGLVDPAETQTFQPLTGYSFEFATAMNLDAILACAPVVDRKHLGMLFRGFFRDGFRCAIVLNEERVVGYMWAFTDEYVVTLDDYRRRNLSVRLDSRSVFTGNAYVASPHRGRGLFQRLKLYLMQHYPPDTYFYTSISDLNAPSLAANRKLGFSKLATLRFIGVFSRTLLYVREKESRQWRAFHTRWPNLKLDGIRLQTTSADSP